MTVPTANNGSPPLEWNRTEQQHNAASFRPSSIQSNDVQLFAGSSKRIQDPQCPGPGGTGPRIGVRRASFSSSSSASSS